MSRNLFKALPVFLLASCLSTIALAEDSSSTRKVLADFSPTTLKVLEKIEKEQGKAFNDEETRALVSSVEFQERLIDMQYYQCMQDGGCKNVRQH